MTISIYFGAGWLDMIMLVEEEGGGGTLHAFGKHGHGQTLGHLCMSIYEQSVWTGDGMV